MSYKVLIPTDFSKNAFNAIQYAFSLLKERSCEILLVHSYYLSGLDKGNLLVPEPSDEERKRVEQTAARQMDELRGTLEETHSNHKHTLRFLTVFGPFYKVMEETVEKENIDLVIMGTKGRSNKNSVILGSNAVNVMEKVRFCPVMAIPSDAEFKKPNEIVFPTSFRSQYREHELEVLVDLASLLNAPIRILHITNDDTLTERQEENKQYLESILLPATFTHHRLYNMRVNDGVRTFIQSRESEMIAFVNKRHNFFGSIFSNPMVKELGTHTEVPILAMHDKRD